jgi:hypothetical protein
VIAETLHSFAQGTLESSVSMSVAGPVGIGAVVVGAGGLIIGLVRRRRVVDKVAEKVVAEKVAENPVPLPGPRQANTPDYLTASSASIRPAP